MDVGAWRNWGVLVVLFGVAVAACGGEDGGPCEYDDTAAILLIESVTSGSGDGSGADGSGDCVTVDISIVDASSREPLDTFVAPESGSYLRSTLATVGLEPDSEYPGTFRLETEGTCSPEIFEFESGGPSAYDFDYLAPDCP